LKPIVELQSNLLNQSIARGRAGRTSLRGVGCAQVNTENDMLDTRIVDAAARLSIAKLGGEGILHIDDLPALGSQRRAVFAFLMDGKWHRGTHILDIAGGTEGLRRMRELRKLPGVEIQRKQIKLDSVGRADRVFWYRMVITKSDEKQIELAV